MSPEDNIQYLYPHNLVILGIFVPLHDLMDTLECVLLVIICASDRCSRGLAMWVFPPVNQPKQKKQSLWIMVVNIYLILKSNTKSDLPFSW